MIPETYQSPNVLELIYWKMRGGAQVVRNLLQFLKLPYKDYFVDPPKTFDVKYVHTTLHTLPKLKDGQFQISHVVPIAKYVCRKGQRPDLLGKNIVDNARIEELIIRHLQFKNSLMMQVLPSQELTNDNPSRRLAFIQQQFQDPMRKSLLQQVNKALGENDWHFGYLTILDFFNYELCFSMNGFFPELIETYHNLCVSFKRKFEQIPAIKEYFSSNRVLNNMTLSNFSTKWKGDPKHA